MMRYLKILFLSVAVIGLMAGPAMAASSIADIAVNRIGWEATNLSGYTTVPANQVGIVYSPDTTLGFSINETITFSLSNGTFQDATFNLCGIIAGTAALADVGDRITGGTGTSQIIFRFSEPTEPGTPIAIANSSVCAPANFVLAIKSNSGLQPNTAVTAAVTDARTVAGNVQITQALTSGSNVGELLFVARQYDMTNLTPDFATITLASNLREFFPEPPSTTATTSNAAFTFVNNADPATWLGTPGSFIADADAASQLITVTNVPSAVSGITYDFASCAFAGGSTWTCTGPPGNTTAGTILDPALGGITAHTISITVDGSTPVDAATINSDIAVNFANVAYLDQTYLMHPSHVWIREGTTIHVGLIKTKGNGVDFETYIKLQSKSTVGPVNVLANVLCSDGTIASLTLGPLTPGTPLLITGTQLATACTVNGEAGFAGTLTVNLQETDVFGYANTCYQGDLGCRRIPLEVVGGTIVE